MKVVLSPRFIVLLLFFMMSFGTVLAQQNQCFSAALTSGFVFKHNDCRFKEIYGRGMINVITGDFCYYASCLGGIGMKVSYWQRKGRTACFNQAACLQEVPITFYLRGLMNVSCRLQGYASLGGGLIWLNEKSYLGHVKKWEGIGEAEIGLNYAILGCFDFTTAFRYLFPRHCQNGITFDAGGLELRAGFGWSF